MSLDQRITLGTRSCRSIGSLVGAAFVAAGLVLNANDAAAQSAPPAAGASATPSAGASGEPQISTTLQTQGGRRVYVSSQVIEVRGEIQRPYAFSLSGRASLGYTYLEVPVHFIQEILDAVRRAPF